VKDLITWPSFVAQPTLTRKQAWDWLRKNDWVLADRVLNTTFGALLKTWSGSLAKPEWIQRARCDIVGAPAPTQLTAPMGTPGRTDPSAQPPDPSCYGLASSSVVGTEDGSPASGGTSLSPLRGLEYFYSASHSFCLQMESKKKVFSLFFIYSSSFFFSKDSFLPCLIGFFSAFFNCFASARHAFFLPPRFFTAQLSCTHVRPYCT
jgi:hypothetical protein